MVKITFIGAGSVVFTRELLSDLLAFEELADTHIALYDIDAERLETAAAMARWTDAQFGGRATITTHADRREALSGADFVINTVQVGMHAATLTDFEIPARYGLRQTIGDTLGIGGIFRALRTIPLLLEIGDELAEVAPDAWLLNYTNPMAILTQAYAEGSPHKQVVGLCHSVQHTTLELAKLLRVPFDEVTFLGAGVNHQAFLLRFERDGEDLYPRLRELMEEQPELKRRVRMELFTRLGYYPTESSEHNAEYLPWFMRDDALVERYRLKIGDYIERSEQNMVEYRETKAGLAGGADFPLKRSLEYASLIVHAMVTGRPQVIYGNVQNNGLIADLPARSAVEVPCLVDRTGLRPTPVPNYPPQLAALNRTFLNVADLTVRAALDGRRDHVLHAAMLDPATAGTLDLDQTAALVDELLAAHGGLMPEGLRA
ncbi:MAG TPA: alpha-glucosidase/alpha-galactosidase [Conexibacter sp.]|nr:alpha-glucosidase/alpha-galactosidase [Conexibacter sp.]